MQSCRCVIIFLLPSLAKRIWPFVYPYCLIGDWAISRTIWLSAAHIPGRDNVAAGELSRTFNLELEWTLTNSVFQKIIACFGQPDIDLFPSRLNALIPTYVSWKPDPMAKHIDAFKVNWSQYSFYAFLPFCLISRCVQKIVQEQATRILVIPLCPSQAYFTTVLNLLTDTPRTVKATVQHLVHPFLDNPHPLHHSLILMVCKLSGDPYMNARFHRKLPISLCSPGEMLHKNNTTGILSNGYTFVTKRRLIHCTPL